MLCKPNVYHDDDDTTILKFNCKYLYLYLRAIYFHLYSCLN